MEVFWKEKIMSRVARVTSPEVSLAEPIDDLRKLGERLQQSLSLTIDRLGSIKSSDLRRRAFHAVDKAHYMFTALSQIAQTTDRLAIFLKNSFGVSTEEIFSMMGGGEYPARVTAHGALTLVNDGIRRVMDDLAQINISIDKEQEHENAKKKS